MENTLVILRSQNVKLTDGNISVAATYRVVGKSCPQNCQFLNKKCYAQRGLVRFNQFRAKKRNDSLDQLAKSDVGLVRWNVSGDIFKNNRLDKPYLKEIFDFHKQNPLKIG